MCHTNFFTISDILIVFSALIGPITLIPFNTSGIMKHKLRERTNKLNFCKGYPYFLAYLAKWINKVGMNQALIPGDSLKILTYLDELRIFFSTHS